MMSGAFAFLSVSISVPPGFTLVAGVSDRQLRRRPFCLFGDHFNTLADFVLPLAQDLVGVVVVPSDALVQERLGPYLLKLSLPSIFLPWLAQIVDPILRCLDDLRSAQELVAIKNGELERTLLQRENSLRDHLESRDVLLREIVERKAAQEELLKTMVSRDELQKEMLERQRAQEDLKGAYEQLRAAQAQLVQSEKMASLGVLAAGVAHEINNPMAFVISNFSVLQEYVKVYRDLVRAAVLLEGDSCQSVGVDVSKVKAFQEMVKGSNFDLMDKDMDGLLSETAAGLLRVKKIVMDMKVLAHPALDVLVEVNINQLLDYVVNLCASGYKDKVEVLKEYGDLPPVKCYEGRMVQVFTNLLVNAFQAIADKGVVRVMTFRQDGFVGVKIIDNGEGIPSNIILKVFDPFFTTKPVGQGTGLGLSVSYDIVRQHQGTMTVESTPGNGSIFMVCLPISGPAV